MSKEAKDYYNEVDPENTYPDGEIEDWLFDKTDMIQFATDFANEQTQPLKDEIKELNKMRVENEKLNKVILNHLEIESSNGRTFKSMSSKLTEANKKLKDSNFAIKTFVDNIDEWLDTGKAAGTKESKRIYDLCKAVLNKSKLNKD